VGAVAVGVIGRRDVIVSASQDRTVRVWDAAIDKTVSYPLTGHTRRHVRRRDCRAGHRDVRCLR
jgi:hypothetical protein